MQNVDFFQLVPLFHDFTKKIILASPAPAGAPVIPLRVRRQLLAANEAGSGFEQGILTPPSFKKAATRSKWMLTVRHVISGSAPRLFTCVSIVCLASATTENRLGLNNHFPLLLNPPKY